MKIFVLIDSTENGPYSKAEIFALLKEHSVSMTTPARLEEDTEYRPLSEILKSGSASLLSVQEIAQKQAETPEAPVVVPELLLPSRPAPIADTPQPKKKVGLLATCVILALCSVVWMVLSIGNKPEKEVASETVNEVAQPTPQETPAIAKATPPKQKPLVRDRATPTPQKIEKNPERLAIVTETPAQEEPEVDTSLELPEPVEPEPEIVENQTSEIPEPPIEPRYRKVELAASKVNPKTDLWTIEYPDQPQGVILFCLDGPLESSDRIQNWENWKTLIRENHLILAVTGLKEMEPEFGDRLLVGLKELGLSKLPILIYGRKVGGTFASFFALKQKGIVKGWAAYTSDVNLAATSSDNRPGLLVTDFEDSKINNVKGQFEAGRKRGQKWTLLTLASDANHRLEDAENFAVSYFQALVNLKNGSECWATIDNPGKADSVEISHAPENVAWLPNDALFGRWMELMPVPEQALDPIVIQKIVKTNVPQQPEVELFLRLPPKRKGSPPPSGILAFTTWMPNPEDIRKQLYYRTSDKKLLSAPGPMGIVARLIRYAEEHNLAVLTWNSVRFWSNDTNSWDLPKEERVELDRAFDRIALAWDIGLRDMLKGTGISDKDMLLYGISRGAMWAQRLVVRLPDHFLATHIHVPISFDTPTEKANKMLWLVTTGEADPGYEHCIKFYELSKKLDYPILFKAIVNLGHDDHPIAENLGFRFFDYALKLRDARIAEAQKESNPIRKQEILNTPIWSTAFNHPPFVGDFLNQEMFPSSQVDMIPVALRVPLPNDQLAEAWNK